MTCANQGISRQFEPFSHFAFFFPKSAAICVAITRIKAEAKTEELKSSTLVACLSKNSATRTATSVLNGMNSLLGANKVSRLEKENAQLHREVEDLNDQIERLHTDMQKIKDSYARELNRINEQHQQEVSNLKRILDKA